MDADHGHLVYLFIPGLGHYRLFHLLVIRVSLQSIKFLPALSDV